MQLTAGEAKTIVKGVLDKGFNQDGFKAFIELNHLCDSRSEASVLRTFLEVISPPPFKGISDIVGGIHKWEGKMAALKTQTGEEVSEKIKHAIFIGMLP